MSSTRLGLHGVRFAYGDGDWSLSVSELEFGRERVTCVVGPNGSGKSTLLRIAAGILRPASGAVLLDGRPLNGMRRRIIAGVLGFLPQESAPLYDCPVETVASMGRYAHIRGIGAMTGYDLRAVNRALAAVGMDALRDRPLSHLSGGERRRAMIASVLAQEPSILLLDEPTAALDMHHAAAVMRLLSELNAAGPSVVVVTHDVNMAALFAERMLLLVDGRLCADGPPEEVVCAEVMKQAYGEDVLVQRHPETGGPMIVPRRVMGAKIPEHGGTRERT